MAKRTGAELIAIERDRQIDKEGYDEEHDAHHQEEELLSAAAAYILRDRSLFPWADRFWKPGSTRERALVKAGALIAAEIDRLRSHL